MSAPVRTSFTVEEYLDLEGIVERHGEFVRGEIFERPGCDVNHCQIVGNLLMNFRGQRRDSELHTYLSMMRVRADDGQMYLYPDFAALVGEPAFETHDERGPTALCNPQVVIEVLSSNSAAFDRGEKFRGYRRIATLTDYLLVSTDERHVAQYTRRPSGIWTYEGWVGAEAMVPLASVDCEIPLAEIYDKVAFPAR